jgi:hypothetical protein
MAHFAKLNNENIVIGVHTLENEIITDSKGVEQEQLGIDFLTELHGIGFWWKQTSYNGTFRKNYAGRGYYYDVIKDAFIPPQLYPSWTLDEATLIWQPPVEYPAITEVNPELYLWNENTLTWDIF